MKCISESRILLFGGTTEGRQMAQDLLERGLPVTVCVATPTGAEYLNQLQGLEVLTGRMDADEMALLMENGFACCIDATHPFAVEATSSIKAACRRAQVPYLRLLRERLTEEEVERKVSGLVRSWREAHSAQMYQRSKDEAQKQSALSEKQGWQDTCGGKEMAFPPRVIRCRSAQEACTMLLEQADSGGRILLTTGAKEAAVFRPLLQENADRVFVRVLPSEESIRQCLAAGFAKENILTGQGPFSMEENVRALRTYRIRCLVTKDGGIEGGYPEKLASAAVCSALVIVIQRPQEEGMSREEILLRLRV